MGDTVLAEADLAGFPQVRALHDYDARSEKELSFKAGDLLTVTDINGDDWWEGALHGRRGFIAAAYVDHNPVRPTGSQPFLPAADMAAASAAVAADDGGGGGGGGGQAAPEPVVVRRVGGRGGSALLKRKSTLHTMDGRPDLAAALRAHGAKHKHDVRGKNELHAAVSKVKSKRAETVTQANDEFSVKLRQRAEQTSASLQAEKQRKDMSELERRFTRQLGGTPAACKAVGNVIQPSTSAESIFQKSHGQSDDKGDNSELGRVLKKRQQSFMY
eukprot:m.42814 g.42814  ORF g.42814 m.42814 type:complete len:273 (-) comp11584_c0_seq1:16-834(-)